MELSHKCDFVNCRNTARYKFEWCSYNQYEEVTEYEAYSCGNPLHLIHLSEPIHSDLKDPDILTNLEYNQEERRLLEFILEKKEYLRIFKK
jgi:hypothetical protein